LGLLVGMQRERVASRLAGLRTFALITVLGALAGLLAESLGGWIVVAALIGVVGALVAGAVAEGRRGEPSPGITTEIAALIMFCTGAYLVLGQRSIAVSLGAMTAVLLWAKPILQGFVQRVGDNDIRAIMQFVIISLVILPILPNDAYGPFDVLNPREIWWMVVLVAGISFAGYIAYRSLGQRVGIVLAGLLGGVISSTATTVSFSRRCAQRGITVTAATVIIMLAGTVVYGRVLAEIAVAAPGRFWQIAPPIMVMLGMSALLAGWLWLRARNEPVEQRTQDNPIELRSAILFGALYACVLLAAAAGHHYFQQRGVYVVAAASGLTDMDAITLSTARLAAAGDLPTETAWRAMLMAAMANMAFKVFLIAVAGSARLFARVGAFMGATMVVAIGLLLFWPAPATSGPPASMPLTEPGPATAPD